MSEVEPIAELTAFSTGDASATPWSEGKARLANARLYWLSTVRPDGRPHVTPLIGAWWDGALHFVTGAGERKAKNLSSNQYCVLTTGNNVIDHGLDIALEGRAELVTGDDLRAAVADEFEAKYGPEFLAPEGTWFGLGDGIRSGEAQLYRVSPSKVFGWEKGKPSGETRWRFRD